MLQVELNTEFPGNLPHVVFLPNLLLLHDLEAADPARFLVPNQHDLAELPLAHFLADCEVGHLELLQVGDLGLVLLLLVHGVNFLEMEVGMGLDRWLWVSVLA